MLKDQMIDMSSNIMLRRHEVDLSHVDIRESDGKDALLRTVNTVVRASTGLSVGFVLDADQVAQNRWQAVRDRHTWLAWQKTPGLPYGSAIRAQFFRHDSSAALAFVNWFSDLFS